METKQSFDILKTMNKKMLVPTIIALVILVIVGAVFWSLTSSCDDCPMPDIARHQTLNNVFAVLDAYYDKFQRYPASTGATPRERWANLENELAQANIAAIVKKTDMFPGDQAPNFYFDYGTSPDLEDFVLKTTLDKGRDLPDKDKYGERGTIFGVDCTGMSFCAKRVHPN